VHGQIAAEEHLIEGGEADRIVCKRGGWIHETP
jgi:hypothetical protein